MSTPKHTPGPWVSGEYSSGTEVTGRNGKTICFLAVSRSDQSPAADASRANATLIAAAPAMYEALQAMLEGILYTRGASMSEDRWRTLTTIAKQALAQAEGKL